MKGVCQNSSHGGICACNAVIDDWAEKAHSDKSCETAYSACFFFVMTTLSCTLQLLVTYKSNIYHQYTTFSPIPAAYSSTPAAYSVIVDSDDSTSSLTLLGILRTNARATASGSSSSKKPCFSIAPVSWYQRASSESAHVQSAVGDKNES